MNTTAYWVETPGRGALRRQPLPAPAPDEVEVVARFSGISCGTERLVGRGRVSADGAEAMACRGMLGTFALPVCYGYCLVGEIATGQGAGSRVFTMHPHQDRAVVARELLVALPDDVPWARATLLPNLETALNAVWDAELRPGEPVVVVGGGAVGLLITYVLAEHHDGPCTLVEAAAERRAFARRLPWVGDIVSPSEVGDGARSVAFHSSGTGAGLQLAIDTVGFEGRVLELSWYGSEPVSLRLGGGFHQARKRLIGSQVGTIAPSHRAAGHAARTQAVLQLLRDARLDSLLGTPIPFADLPTFFARLYRGEATEPCPFVEYDRR